METDNISAKLTRTGKRPLAFRGRELCSLSTRDHNSTRWSVCRVFESKAGKIVVGIGNLTCWDGEKDYCSAEIFDTREQAITHIETTASRLAEEAADKLNVFESVE